jgi:IMP dehydrogenase
LDDNRSGLRLVGDALSFDDVVLLPGLSPVEPWQVDTTAKPSRSVKTAIPLVSAPMDTVSEWRMGVALALLGGMAVIHRNMPIEEQLRHVEKVKNHPPVILRDVAFRWEEECCRVRDALRAMGLRDAPILGSDGRVAGRARLADLFSCTCGTPVGKLAQPPVAYSVEEIEEARQAVIEGRSDAAAIHLGGTYLGALVLEEAAAEYRPSLDEEGRLRVAAAVSPFDRERIRRLDGVADVLVADVAHFHNRNVLSAAAQAVREMSSDFVVGNLGTKDGVIDTITRLEKVDGLRMGIAGGNICTTSGVAGVAAPTLYAVAQARAVLEEHGVSPRDVPVIADGGVRGSGDAVKALAAGAYTVMAGYMLAGTDEAAAPLIRIGGSLYKPYRGMASRGALERRYAADRYSRVAKKVEEGIEGLVPYRGPVRGVVEKYVEGVKAGLGYAGASSIPDLWAKARFARITSRIGAFTGTVRTSL